VTLTNADGGNGGMNVDADLEAAMHEAAQALTSGGLADVAERAWAQLTAPPEIPTLVIIGEIKRGKSLLANALLGHADLSPVDVEIATSAYIRFIPVAGSASDRDTALLFAGGLRKAVDFKDLPDWVTTTGRHVVDSTIDELPIGAEVSVDGRFLPHIAVVDTPGVGGLNPNHLRLARTASTSASILLMTCDATAPITAPELSFLESVSAEVDSVLIAVTKIDKNYRHWRSIVSENRRLLREHAPRFADVPIVGVSSLRAVAALGTEPGERRESALQASGLPQLVGHLEQISGAADKVSRANGLRTARSGLDQLIARIEVQRSVILGGEETATELTAEEQRLKELKKRESTWRDELTRDLAAVQRETLESSDHQLDELKATWKRRFDRTGFELLRRSPQQFVADITADIEALVARVSDEYLARVAKLTEERSIELKLALEAFDTTVRGEQPRKRTQGVFDPTMVSFITMGSNTLGHALLPHLGIAAGAALGFLAGPVTLALGGAWAAVNLGFRAVRQSRQNMTQWVNTTAMAVNKDLMRAVQERQEMVRPAIVNEYRQQLNQSISEVQKLVTAAQNAVTASREEREKAAGDLDERRAALEATAAALDAQLAGLAARPAADDPAAATPISSFPG